jgi:fructokinase
MTHRHQAGLVGAIEAGGTHYRCALGSPDGDIFDVASFATTEPAHTLGQAIAFFAASRTPLRALGIAHFGPVDIDPQSSRYGHVLATPKPGWSGSDVLGRFRSAFNVPTVFQSDVNAAAIGEGTLGAAQGKACHVYVTIGTGIGGGVVVDGRLLQDMQHPELGHMWVGRAPDDTYPGCCPFHGDCLEGLAAGPALHGRWQAAGETLPPDHPAWVLQAFYLARMCMNITLCYAPQRIVLGGGAMQLPGLLARIQSRFLDCMKGYRLPEGGAGHFICAPALQGQSALRGALILAGRALAPAQAAMLSNR